MYQPWGKDPADAIIELIEEKERKESKYSPYENDNWSIVSYKQFDDHTEEDRPKRKIEQETSAVQWRSGHLDPRPRDPWDGGHGVSRRTAVAPSGRWGSQIAESINKQLKAEIDVELTVRKRSNSSEERAELRQRRRHVRPQKYETRNRSSSMSISPDRKPYRRSRSNPRLTKRRSRSRSSSRDGKRKINVPRVRKRERSDSRDRKRRKNSSKDRRADRNDRYRSRSRSTERKRDTRSPRRRSPTPKAQDKPAETTTDILSKFVNMMQEVKKEQPAPAQIAPNPNVLPEFDSSDNGYAIIPWLLRVDDVAKLFGWGDKETTQYALTKLVGDAQAWYQTLEAVPYTWAEWRKTLKEKFQSLSYGRLIIDMTKRHALPTETLEKYYNDKMLLVNRCGFKGRYAVDCVLTGVKLESIRLCAEAADFAEPEELLKYFKSVEVVWQKTAKSIKITEGPAQNALKAGSCYRCGNKGHRADACELKQQKNSKANTTNPDQPAQSKANIVCPICGKNGHEAVTCWQKQESSNADTTKPDQPAPPKTNIVCSFCGKNGHEAAACWHNQENSNADTNPDHPKNTQCFVCGQNGHKSFACTLKLRKNTNQTMNNIPQNAQTNFGPLQFRPQQRFKTPQQFKVRPFQPQKPNRPNKPVGKQKKRKLCLLCGKLGHYATHCPAVKAGRVNIAGPSNVFVPLNTRIPASSDSSISNPPVTYSTNEPAPPGVEE